MKQINRLLEIMDAIRKECPWDAKQTHQSLKRYLVEEAYETLDVIDNEDYNALKSELGDLLLQIIFHCKIAQENARFSFADVVETISDKMVERHPHVFAKDKNLTYQDVEKNWELRKKNKEARTSLLSGTANHLPALLKTQRMLDKAESIDFEYINFTKPSFTFEEHINKLHTTHQKEAWFGQALFTLIALAKQNNLVAEDVLNKQNQTFKKQFQKFEKNLENSDSTKSISITILKQAWDKAGENS